MASQSYQSLSEVVIASATRGLSSGITVLVDGGGGSRSLKHTGFIISEGMPVAVRDAKTDLPTFAIPAGDFIKVATEAQKPKEKRNKKPDLHAPTAEESFAVKRMWEAAERRDRMKGRLNTLQSSITLEA